MVYVWIAIGAVALAAAVLFNSLVRARNRVDEGWAQIDVQLRRRHDLIPNLVETVRAYADHEQAVLTSVAEARAAAVSADGPSDTADAEARLEGAVRSLFAVAEDYPQLRANENFLELQRELTTTEDRVAYSRQYYNDAVRAYDTRRQSFPGNLIAASLGFEDREYYEAEPEARQAPRANL